MSKNDKEFYYGINNEELVKGGVFERFPELIPAVGEHYWRKDGKHKKMIIIGESNYFPQEMESESVFQNPEEWYKGDTDKLIPESMVDKVKNWKGYWTFTKVFDLARQVLTENGIQANQEQDEAVFYNYFLRPALNPGNGVRKEFKPQWLDKEVAGLALTGVIEKLEPELIVFVSAKAHIEYMRYMGRHNIQFENVEIQKVAHPSCAWWNRNNGVYGKNKLKDILNKYWINK